jgi:hypothetical protein
MYKVVDICTTIHLEPADLLLVALLAGGDYSVSPDLDRIPPAA